MVYLHPLGVPEIINMHRHSCFSSRDFIQSLQKLRIKCHGFALWKAKLPETREFCIPLRACELRNVCRALIINTPLWKVELPLSLLMVTIPSVGTCPVLVYFLFLPLISTHSSETHAKPQIASLSAGQRNTSLTSPHFFKINLSLTYFSKAFLLLTPLEGSSLLLK